jgi:CBS domain-containing protein
MKPILVRDLMNPRLMTVAPSDSLRELVDFLRENRIHGALVQDAGRLVGVVSATDVLVYLSDETVDPEYGFSRLFVGDGELSEPLANHLGEATVEELMTPAVFSIDAQATAGAAAALMHQRGVQRLVVLEDEAAVGVLSSSDLVPVVQRYEAGLA